MSTDPVARGLEFLLEGRSVGYPKTYDSRYTLGVGQRLGRRTDRARAMALEEKSGPRTLGNLMHGSKY